MTSAGTMLPPGAAAFDAVADRFDERFGEWKSVAAQRAAVRRHLLRAFPAGSRLLELAGGTGEDALFLAAADRDVLLTDGAPTMLDVARRKMDAAGLAHRTAVAHLLLEDRAAWSELSRQVLPFDGAYSNFAGLNCVSDLAAVARGLAPLLREGAPVLLVVFGPFAPGEVVVQLGRRDVRAAFRRLRQRAPARLGGSHFEVHYARPHEFARAFSPWFRLRRTRGIGIFVPPSATEPAVSRFPRLLRTLSAIDRVLEAPLAHLGDHVLLHFVRTRASGGEAAA